MCNLQTRLAQLEGFTDYMKKTKKKNWMAGTELELNEKTILKIPQIQILP